VIERDVPRHVSSNIRRANIRAYVDAEHFGPILEASRGCAPWYRLASPSYEWLWRLLCAAISVQADRRRMGKCHHGHRIGGQSHLLETACRNASEQAGVDTQVDQVKHSQGNGRRSHPPTRTPHTAFGGYAGNKLAAMLMPLPSTRSQR
jgi:hypothetical protein